MRLRWDHIVYTGNSVVGKIVMKAAAEHLTPVTLELGGKSPTVVLPGANIKVAAKRICSAKGVNAGQICIAPDYVLVHKDVEEDLLAEIKAVWNEWFPDGAKEGLGRIISKSHFNRIRGLIETADGGQVVEQRGELDESQKFIPPTVIKSPNLTAQVMQQEIFGPVLPMQSMGSVEEMIAHINSGEKPLALYVFGPEAECDKVIAQTSSGGVCVNDCLMHNANPDLPFGGVGNSGIGRYHGKWGFDEFSHLRGVMYRATWVDPSLRYPPYTEGKLKLLEKVVLGPLLPPAAKNAFLAVGGIAAAALIRSRL